MNHASLNPLMLPLDLELNQPSKRIIQTGAVTGNVTTGDILDRVSIVINPFLAVEV